MRGFGIEYSYSKTLCRSMPGWTLYVEQTPEISFKKAIGQWCSITDPKPGKGMWLEQLTAF